MGKSGGVDLATLVDDRLGAHGRSIVVTNQIVDPRGVNSANFNALVTAGGTINQAPTNRADGYQQSATPKSCQETIITPAAGTNTCQLLTALRVAGHGVVVNPMRPMVAVRCAAKLSGNLGNAWICQLSINYSDASGTFLNNVIIWTGGPNQITLGQWFVMEGFDAQTGVSAPTAAFAEISIALTGLAANNPVTIRGTEFVVATDPDAGVPSYVGGDVAGGVWNGTADASTSTVQFDPHVVYGSGDLGVNTFEISGAAQANPQLPLPFTPAQGVNMLRAMGCHVARISCAFLNGVSPAPPTAAPAVIQYMQACIGAGLKVIPVVGGVPSWMAPTHFGLTQAGNTGGSISAAATTMNVTGSLPTNLTLPATFTWNDGSSEVATITALNGGVATITRPSNSVAHNDNVTLLDAQFNLAFGHIYYPDPAYRTTFAQAVVNLITQLGAQNIRGIQLSNEPNLAADDTRNEGAAGYSALLNVVHDAVKAQYPNVSIMGGVVAGQVSSTPNAGDTDPVTFLNGMFTAGAKYDYLDAHFYPGTANGAGRTPSSGPDWGKPASSRAGFDAGIKRIKDALAANGVPNQPMYVSETGATADKPNERVHGQTMAMLVGRLLRDPQVAGVCINQLAAAPNNPNLFAPFDLQGLRPRPAARALARIRGVPFVQYVEDIVRWPSGAAVRGEPQAFIDAVMPWTIHLVPVFSTGAASGDADIIRGTWTLVAVASQFLGFLTYNSTNAQNDEIGYQVPLAAGAWEITLVYEQAPANAIYTVNLDGVSQGVLVDSYAAAASYNHVAKIGFAVNQSGNHVVSFKAATRNAAATGWTLAHTAIQLRRLS